MSAEFAIGLICLAFVAGAIAGHLFW